MRLSKTVILLGLVPGLLGCALVQDQQVTYLRGAVGHASQEEVRQEFGPPRQTTPLQVGGSVWVYHFWSHSAGSYGSSSAESYCDAYSLTFDTQTILRDWRHQKC
jgi:hypothetical protein